MGIEPVYNTLFSFKNTVDNFYIKFLEKETILVDIFYIPKARKGGASSGAIKLGSAKLPLHKLLDKDYSFQAQEILPQNAIESSGAESQSIGKLFYRMRPRKPLDEAIKWYRERQLLKTQKASDISAGKSKQARAADEGYELQIVEIEVKSARALRISGQSNQYATSMMKPFFTYEFYKFSHSSAVVLGNEPNFADRK